MRVRRPRGDARGLLLWLVLIACIVAWTIFLWHPWIDWFGRPRP